MSRHWLFSATLLVALAIAFVSARPALAHGGHSATSQTFTQAIGPYELAITLEIPTATPAPLYLTIVPQDDVAGATMTFRAVPRGQSFEGAPSAQVQGLPGPQGSYFTELQLDRDGDWDVEVRIAGPKGSGIARIPFTATTQPLPPGSLGLFISLGGLVALMIVSIALSATYQRRQRAAPAWTNWLLGQGMFACLIVAVVFGIQQFSAAIQSAQAASDPTAATTGLGRPHANVALRTEPAMPVAGQTLTLTLDLSDGSTGLPIEDLTPHHDALIHLVVVDADGAFFAHIHPPRIAPGRYSIPLTPDRPGRYTAYIEIQRQDSGIQVIEHDFEVGGVASGGAPAAPPGLGMREIAGMQVNVTSSLTPLRAGRQATFTFSFGSGGAPVVDLQPWLGMAGHLIARSADGAIYGHIHAIGPVAPSGVLASGIAYGPDIRFVYTFPQPGRYQLWGQFRHNGQVVTVPLVVEVG